MSLQRCVLDRKVTLQTLCTYDQYLRTLFMEWHPGTKQQLRLRCYQQQHPQTFSIPAQSYGPRPLSSTRRHGLFLKSTCDMSLGDIGHFLNSTCNIGEKKRQGHATLAFLKIDMRHRDPPSRAPVISHQPAFWEQPVGCCIRNYGTL